MGHEWDPEIVVRPDVAGRLIAAQFPELAPVRADPFGFGFDNTAYLVNGSFVFRFPRRSIAAVLIEREARILPLVAPLLPLPISSPAFVGVPGEDYPWPFAGYPLMAGTCACSVALSDPERSALAGPLGTFLRALHGIDPGPARERGLPPDELGRLDHARRFPLARERFAQLEAAGLFAQSAPLLAFMERIAPAGPRTERAIVHGDFYARHLLLDGQRRPAGVIDWGDVHAGDPALDLMVAFSLLAAPARGQFWDAYGPVAQRTRELALYRAIYHNALLAHYGHEIGDDDLRESGVTGLEFTRDEVRSSAIR